MLSYKVSIIGSFRRKYDEVVRTVNIFTGLGLYVASPKGSQESNRIDNFVVFETDNKEYSPVEIQMITLEKILDSDAVYVCDTDGYVGKTTCYEIGFCYSRNKPIYFSNFPKDLPMPVDKKQIVSPEEFASIVLENKQRIFMEFEGMCKPAKKAMTEIFPFNFLEEKASKKKKVVICGSMKFYEQMLECQKFLHKNEIESVVPKEENQMVNCYDEEAFIKFKRSVSRNYLKKIREKDTIAILVYNGEKNGVANYIGANTLVEIAMAFTWNRKIYLINDIYEPLADELLAWRCVCLKGNLNKIIEDMNDIHDAQIQEYKQLSFLDD